MQPDQKCTTLATSAAPCDHHCQIERGGREPGKENIGKLYRAEPAWIPYPGYKGRKGEEDQDGIPKRGGAQGEHRKADRICGKVESGAGSRLRRSGEGIQPLATPPGG